MKHRIALVLASLALVGSVAGCATVGKFFRRPPVEVANDLIVAAEWGIAEAHNVEWLSDADLVQWVKIDAAVHDVISENPKTPCAAAALALRAWVKRELAPDSRLGPYLLALAQALELNA